MKQMGMLFSRNTALLVLVLLVVTISVPFSQPVFAAATTSDDFNRCSYDNTFWTIENPTGVASGNPVITGAYTGDSSLTMSVPAGTHYRFSNNGTEAPRIWHKISDGNINYEVKFMAPLIEPSAGNWKINGVLIRDNSQGSPRYFRIEYDTTAGGLNRYVAYINQSGGLTHVISSTGPIDAPGGVPQSGPLFIRIAYDKASTLWTITWQVGTSGANIATDTFTGSTYDPAFTLTDIGLFVGSTGTNPPGATMTVDYIKDLNDGAFADDGTVLTVQKLGSGSGSVNWPITSPGQCSGNQVTLTAAAQTGSYFAGWSGGVPNPGSTNPVTTVTMDTSKNVIATFVLGSPTMSHTLFLPSITR